MRSTLYLKYIIAYAIFGFLCLFCVETLASTLILNQLKAQEGEALYQEATMLSMDYLPGYFSKSLTRTDVHTQLKSMQYYNEMNAWLVDQNGKMITSVTLDDYGPAPSEISDFNPAEHGGDTYRISTYHDYFDENVITVITPVTSGFSVNGYLLLHKPYALLKAQRDRIMEPLTITVLVIYLLSFGLLIVFHFMVYRPLRKITEAARQYASGNLEYEIPVNSQDEMGYLSASLNYMSSQLKDMEQYQKNFIANVSHDFRSPLTSIKGYLEAMADGTIPAEMQEKYFKIILFETERLTDLTRDLLTLNEFDTKNLMLNITTFDIHEVIKNTASTFEGVCKTRKISIKLLLAGKMLFVSADKPKIQQVLYNLLDNAIKFSANDSEILIETTERGGKIFLSVKDHGIGIPKNEWNKVWERFYKSDLSRGKDKKGTGLGLSIVKEILQAHGENINLVSTEGVGTEFIFSLKKGS